MTKTHIIALVCFLAVNSCGVSKHARSPSDEHPTDMSSEPENSPPEGAPGQTMPITKQAKSAARVSTWQVQHQPMQSERS
jgi:hypothetical protein